MTHRSPKTVEPPDDERISTSQTVLATRKPWSIRFCTGEFVAEDVLTFDAVIQKRINLEREFLVPRADVCIRIPPILQVVRLVKVGSC